MFQVNGKRFDSRRNHSNQRRGGGALRAESASGAATVEDNASRVAHDGPSSQASDTLVGIWIDLLKEETHGQLEV